MNNKHWDEGVLRGGGAGKLVTVTWTNLKYQFTFHSTFHFPQCYNKLPISNIPHKIYLQAIVPPQEAAVAMKGVC